MAAPYFRPSAANVCKEVRRFKLGSSSIINHRGLSFLLFSCRIVARMMVSKAHLKTGIRAARSCADVVKKSQFFSF